MNTNDTQTKQGGPQNNNGAGQNQNQNSRNAGYQNASGYNYKTDKNNYPKKRSTGAMIAGIILILLGTSHIVDKFLPWVFDWLDTGLVFAGAAILAGFVLLLKK